MKAEFTVPLGIDPWEKRYNMSSLFTLSFFIFRKKRKLKKNSDKGGEPRNKNKNISSLSDPANMSDGDIPFINLFRTTECCALLGSQHHFSVRMSSSIPNFVKKNMYTK